MSQENKYKILYIFVEGNDDERFFERILKPELQNKYDDIRIIKYAQKDPEYVERFIKSAKKIGDYIYVTDINNSPCITVKKQEIRRKLKNIEYTKILIVIKEIESWYLAGLDSTSRKCLRINRLPNVTDHITKEDFYNLMPPEFNPIDFLIEILNNFSLHIAKQKNRSLKYCIEKYLR